MPVVGSRFSTSLLPKSFSAPALTTINVLTFEPANLLTFGSVLTRRSYMIAADGVVINTQALSKEYKGVRALDGLTLQVPKNSIFGFLGPNGAGKSTTIKLLLGLI